MAYTASNSGNDVAELQDTTLGSADKGNAGGLLNTIVAESSNDHKEELGEESSSSSESILAESSAHKSNHNQPSMKPTHGDSVEPSKVEQQVMSNQQKVRKASFFTTKPVIIAVVAVSVVVLLTAMALVGYKVYMENKLEQERLEAEAAAAEAAEQERLRLEDLERQQREANASDSVAVYVLKGIGNVVLFVLRTVWFFVKAYLLLYVALPFLVVLFIIFLFVVVLFPALFFGAK